MTAQLETPTPAPPKRRRSAVITIVGIVLLLTSLINLAIAAVSAFAVYATSIGGTIELYRLDEESILELSGAGFSTLDVIEYTILGIVQLIITIGFFRLARWAWVAAITWQAIKLIIMLVHFFTADLDGFTLLVTIIIVLMLNQTEVRRTFGILQSQDESTSKPTVRVLHSD